MVPKTLGRGKGLILTKTEMRNSSDNSLLSNEIWLGLGLGLDMKEMNYKSSVEAVQKEENPNH